MLFVRTHQHTARPHPVLSPANGGSRIRHLSAGESAATGETRDSPALCMGDIALGKGIRNKVHAETPLSKGAIWLGLTGWKPGGFAGLAEMSRKVAGNDRKQGCSGSSVSCERRKQYWFGGRTTWIRGSHDMGRRAVRHCSGAGTTLVLGSYDIGRGAGHHGWGFVRHRSDGGTTSIRCSYDTGPGFVRHCSGAGTTWITERATLAGCGTTLVRGSYDIGRGTVRHCFWRGQDGFEGRVALIQGRAMAIPHILYTGWSESG